MSISKFPHITKIYDSNGNVIDPAEVQQKTAFNEVLSGEITPKVQIDFPYNINMTIVDTALTGSGTVTQTSSKAVVQTQSNTSSTATLTSKRVVKYDPGQGSLVRFTALFTQGSANSQQEIGVGDTVDGYFFGYNGISMGVLRRQDGTDFWTAKEDWNKDNADGTGILPLITFNSGNVYEIRYQWLGFGLISFLMENPTTGKFVRVHELQYANSSNLPSIFNPTLPLCIRAQNTTNNSNTKIETSSMGGFVEGREVKLGPKNSFIHTNTSITTTETSIMTVRNETSFSSKTNRVEVELDFLGTAVDGTKPAEIRIIKNAVLGGVPSYTNIDANSSVIATDTSGTTISGGQALFSFALAKADGKDINLVGLGVDLEPGDTLTIAGRATAGTTDATGSLSWIERF